MESQSDQQERLRSNVQDFGSAHAPNLLVGAWAEPYSHPSS